MKKLIALFVKDREDIRLFVGAVALIIAALAVLVYDVVTIAAGTVDLNRHMPFILTFGFGGIAACILTVLRHGVKGGDRADLAPGKESYQHPDNWPRDRIDAPDGTSD